MKDIFKIYLTFCKIGFFMFGGGYSILPYIEEEFVYKKKLIKKENILDYYALCQATPGIIAVNMATIIGYKEKKFLGSVFATLGIISPSIFIIIIIDIFFNFFISINYIQHAFNGIKILALSMIMKSIFRIFNSAIYNIFGWILFTIFLGLMFFLKLKTLEILFFAFIIGFFIGLIKKLILKNFKNFKNFLL